jgi:photosystem II stability/assembly factor-like uncharacterized protein
MRLSLLVIFALTLFTCQQPLPPKQSGAAESLEWWALARAWPEGKIRSDIWAAEFMRLRDDKNLRSGGAGAEWQSLGPKNFGGRMLCLAFHPDNPDIIYAGAASGGLWKTETAGEGAQAWTYVPTGFPLLGVAAIAIDPNDPDVIYLGTGEVYNYTAAQPGIVNRFTRGTYGIGILKSVDGGASWFSSLDWTTQEMTGVQDLLINPLNTQTIYAATTEGLLRSYNGGLSWENIHPKSMAVDIEMHLNDTATLWVSHGNYLSPDKGVYRTQNAGQSFQLLSNGIPTNYTGKTMLARCPSVPDKLYASVANSNASIGLFTTDNKGDTWVQLNTTDVAKFQGWYSHDLAVKPNNANQVVYCGVDAFLTTDGGSNVFQTAYWYNWYLGLTQPGEPEGPPNYVHADIHAVYFHPLKPNTVFLATDGGVFVSQNGGYSWEARNGGLQTQQFYANFSNSTTDTLFAMGGMQDNASAIYIGLDGWWRVLGGDGMCTAIHPQNDSIIFGSYQNLNIRRSLDRGNTFLPTLPQEIYLETRAFNAPFEMAPSNPSILYAGAQRLFRTNNLGNTWAPTSSGAVDGSNVILTIAVGPEDPDLVYVSTASPTGTAPPSVKKSVNGGQTWQTLSGLPDRLAMDIAIHPDDPMIAYIVFSGFGTAHLYRTTNGGATWAPIGFDLPDAPANSLVIDPKYPAHLYLGNDLGVFASTDGGNTWAYLWEGLPDAVLAMHLSISPLNRKLRLATHGNGVYETDLLEPAPSGSSGGASLQALRLYPNPARERIYFQGLPAKAELNIFTIDGKWVMRASASEAGLDISALPPGMYVCQVQTGAERSSIQFVIQ